MTTFHAITTCHRAGWDGYGCRMVSTFREFWPAEVPLTIYSEDVIPNEVTKSLPAWLFEFKERHAKNKATRGHLNGGGYNYRFDAVRFAHKTAAVIDAIEISTADVVIWIDADTLTHAPVTLGFLEELAPTPWHALAWLDRKTNYPECGFYMVRRGHEMVEPLVANWKGLYVHDVLFHLAEWHDSFALQEMVRALAVPWKSLSGAAAGTGHPFINGPLGAVMDHLKGPRKARGQSTRHDLKIARSERYWKDLR